MTAGGEASHRPPNILIILADFMGALSLPPYGNTVAKTPNISRLAEGGVVFENAYCNSPLCAPSRASMMSSLLPSEIGVYDNGAEFPASIPTFAHYLRRLGYRCEVSGKLHFVGPDQLHGFDERLTSDMVPADFGWMPPWRNNELAEWPSLEPILEAGIVSRTIGIDFDEEVTHRAVRRIYDFARDPEQQPFLLTVSYIEPHEPYRTTRENWDRYTDNEVGLPAVPLPPEAEWDAHSRRLYEAMGLDRQLLTDEQVVRARHGYYAMLSFVDQKIGEVLAALRDTRQASDTVVIITADHGSMLGERGLWGILSFFEWAVRVPLILHAPSLFSPRRVAPNVSLVDLLPTLLDIATDGQAPALATPIEGESVVSLAAGDASGHRNTVYAELSAEGSPAPCVMIKRGSHKFIHSETDPPLMFDLASDPTEQTNLAGRPDSEALLADFQREVHGKWDLARWHDEVEKSRRRRILVYETYERSNPPVWDYAVNNDPWRFYQRSFREPWQLTEKKATLI